MKSIERDRRQLTVLYLELRKAQQAANIMDSNNAPVIEVDRLNIWDELEFGVKPNDEDTPMELEVAPLPAPAPTGKSPPAIEDYLIPLPSNGNVDSHHSNLELSLRSSRAEHHLTRIRELIAEKSFQYSHVICNSPRKGPTTRSRSSIKKLNSEIALHCRLYSRCRAQLVILGGDQSRFKVLTPADVKASTAIIKPNDFSSTRLKLSWIWETSGGHRFGLASAGAGAAGASSCFDASLVECMYFYMLIVLHNAFLSIVQRVHWLRSRAQLMRWQEEVTLIIYEMHWTVRFFAHKSKMWANAGQISGLPLKAGLVAYAKRQNGLWEQIAIRANRTFTYLNCAYKCPL